MGGILVSISSCGVGKIFRKEDYYGLWGCGLKDLHCLGFLRLQEHRMNGYIRGEMPMQKHNSRLKHHL